MSISLHHARTLAVAGCYLMLAASGCTQATRISEQHEQERQKIAPVERGYQHCLRENDAKACREVWDHQIELCGRGGAMDLDVFGPMTPFRPACDKVTNGDAFFSRYPTAAQCRDNNSQACNEVCHLAFDESGGWSLQEGQGVGKPIPLLECDAIFFPHYWPCLASKTTVKEVLGPLAASACANPNSKIRCSHQGPNTQLTCEPATN